MPLFPFYSSSRKNKPGKALPGVDALSAAPSVGKADVDAETRVEADVVPGVVAEAGAEAGTEAGVSGWPFPRWTRYRVEAFLGRGAMGEVYCVFDPVLNRSVAIKILGDGLMHHAGRFLLEARAMARVEHPNVAKIFEVGVVEDRPYFAMQLLHGDSLHVMRDRMGLEERVEMMRQACEGVQAAHRTGLLHRDLKPSNIVVEKDADACWHAFVVDFGLACDAGGDEPLENSAAAGRSPDPPNMAYSQGDAPAATLAADVTGTPAFMSPEQASGEALDRRSDVFSLGSTLYAVLTGSLPFIGQSLLSIMGNVALSRPAPLNAYGAKIPKDLEAIVQKAMEKDPLKRYPSARALSLDLERWLNGEAVEAMEAVARKPFYRLGRWVKKNRAMAGLGVLLLLSLLGALGLGLRAHWRSQAQARYYQFFCQEAERMETKLALAEAMPLHDTQPERQAIQAQMLELEKIMARAGSVAEAPGHYALGRGYLVLEKWQKAREALEKCWTLGLQTPEVALALGHCLNQVYFDGLEGLQGNSLQERKKTLDIELKPFINKYLSMVGPGMQGSDMDLVGARRALVEGRYDEAKGMADRLLEEDPSHLRALLLKADICQAQAESRTEGEAFREEAKALLERARDSARSAAIVYEKQALVFTDEFRQRIHQRKPFMASFNGILEAVRLARQANSRSHRAWEIEASAWVFSRDHGTLWFWRSSGEWEKYPEVMQRAIASADQALALDGDPMQAINAKGIAYWFLSEWNRLHGAEYQTDLDKAIATFQAGLRLPHPLVGLYSNLGSCYAIRGNRHLIQGIDPMADYHRALENYTIMESKLQNPTTYLNISLSYFEIAVILQWQAQPFKDVIQRSQDYARRMLSTDQGFNGQCAMARNYLWLAEHAAWQGKLDEESLRQGTKYAKQSMAIQAQDPEAMDNRVWSILLEAFTGGKNPDLKLAEGLIRQLSSNKKEENINIYKIIWMELEKYRRAPTWRAFLALEAQINQALKSGESQPTLHFLAFEACRIGFERQAPGATPEQWRSRMKEHIQWAKRLNPLIAPWAGKVLKERGGVPN